MHEFTRIISGAGIDKSAYSSWSRNWIGAWEDGWKRS